MCTGCGECAQACLVLGILLVAALLCTVREVLHGKLKIVLGLPLEHTGLRLPPALSGSPPSVTLVMDPSESATNVRIGHGGGKFCAKKTARLQSSVRGLRRFPSWRRYRYQSVHALGCPLDVGLLERRSASMHASRPYPSSDTRQCCARRVQVGYHTRSEVFCCVGAAPFQRCPRTCEAPPWACGRCRGAASNACIGLTNVTSGMRKQPWQFR